MHKNYLILLILNLSVLTAEYPDYEVVVNNNPFPSKLMIHSMSSSNPYMGILNEDLSLYWSVNSGNTGMNFNVSNNHISYFDKGSVSWIVADTLMNEIDTLVCANNIMTDYHEILLLNDGYILQGYDSIWMDMSVIIPEGNPFTLIKDVLVIQEFNNNDSLIFEWNAAEHLDIADYIDNFNFFIPEITWMHGNSMEIDTDQNLLVSNRNSNEIFKINRTSGEIIWILGGPLNEFTFINDPLNGFSQQHDVRRIENGNITLFDNGTQHEPMISRALEYEIDEINKTATLVWDYTYPDNLVAMSMGSVQRLPNNNTLINWGFFFETDSINSGTIITEVDYDKNIVLEIRYPSGYYCYRAKKYDWEFAINTLIGDVNLDEILNILDVILLTNHILYNPGNNLFSNHKMDLNSDGEINIIDINRLIDIIIN